MTTAQPIPPALISAERERRYIRWVLSPGLQSPALEHLRDPEKLLRSSEFYGIAHQAIWEAVESTLATSGRLFLGDVETAVSANPRGGKAGVTALRDLCRVELVARTVPELVADDVELGQLAEDLRELAAKRLRLRAWQHGAAAAADDNHDGAERALAVLCQSSAEDQRVEYLETAPTIGRVYTDRLQAQSSPERLHRTGFPLFDWAIGDLKRQTLWVIGGTSSSGKSSFALAVAMRMAKAGIRGGWISFEDPPAVIGERLASIELNIDFSPERVVSQFEYIRLGNYVQKHDGDRLVRFAFPLNLGVAELMTAIRLLAEQGAEFVVVDYLQAIRQPASADRRNFVRDVVARAKAECAARNMNLILLSQLSRPKDDPFAEPTNSRLKESSDIEDKAEVISLMWKTGDDERAKVLSKITKVKWSSRRPRGELKRNEFGTVVTFDRVEATEAGPANEPQRPRGRVPRPQHVVQP